MDCQFSDGMKLSTLLELILILEIAVGTAYLSSMPQARRRVPFMRLTKTVIDCIHDNTYMDNSQCLTQRTD